MQIDLSAAPFNLTSEQIKWVEDTRDQLTDEQKVGQLLVCMGQDFPIEQLEDYVREGKVGGVLFRPAPADTIRDWFGVLDKAAPVPLLKAANLEEGGSGGTTDGTLFGWPMLSAATDSEEVVEHFANVCAYEGREIGVNCTYSPVADIDNNFLNPITNVRSYGSDFDRVKRFTQIYMETVQKAGMAASAKHFPGDGVDFRDHHLHPTYNDLPADEWYNTYGAIYENLIAHGLMVVMVGHIVQPNVEMDINPELRFEDCLPGSLSKELLTGVLRERYGFNGVISTDATIMGGYCEAMERRKALPASIMAGCDMLVFNTDLEEDYRYLLEAVQDGTLTHERLDEAVTRILALKAKVCDAPLDEEMAACVKENARTWHQEAVDQSVTLVKNISDHILPVTREKYDKIRLITLGKDDILDGSMTEIGKAYLEEKGFEVEVYDPYADNLHGTSGLDPRRLTLYLANYEQASNQTTVRIKWCDKHALDSPRYVNEEDYVFLSFANPYLLMDAPRVPVYVNAYTATADSIRQTIDKVMGKSEFKGINPVDPFCGLPDTHL